MVGSRLVVDQERAWQCYGARAGQAERSIDDQDASGRAAEHRGERGVRRDVREDRPRWRACLGDRAAGRAAEAAGLCRRLARAEEAARIGVARGGGGERRESDGNRADERAVTAAAAPWRAGAVVGRTPAGGAWPARAWRSGGADAARRAVARVARRAGGGAGHPGARATIAGPRHAPRARLGPIAGW